MDWGYTPYKTGRLIQYYPDYLFDIIDTNYLFCIADEL